ncbi:hypothetical protein SAV14893_023840 [Streptomyces avermitilis]|uniref:Uncharacterized protein n=1 Tax=Streptomyces avermitilis TaxID=33903 RepID=A0A4D4MXI0_STRAX|nr:hypothetical protein SAVMC3_35930 [Streptomyces avermitilis]GDY62991.1 hypothetical protein SAV14893_023840 [Streptomyces avermitilis]GDY76880.1 hypothetical protein SAV31267_063650 [Streptomyces avermitilis]GDY85798.1 hypothetical protein SAVCW2_49970 [Streptomyces avermitilis]
MGGPDGLAPVGVAGTGTLPYADEDIRMKGSPTCDCNSPGSYPQGRTGERDVRTGRDRDGADGVQ